jgi:hypothetical protein
MTGLPPGEFSLTSPGTKKPGQVSMSSAFSGRRELWPVAAIRGL